MSALTLGSTLGILTSATGAGLTIEAGMTDVFGDTTNSFTAEAKSGASGEDVGVVEIGRKTDIHGVDVRGF